MMGAFLYNFMIWDLSQNCPFTTTSFLLHLIIVLLLHQFILALEQKKIDGNCLKQDKLTFHHRYMGNIYIVYERNLLPFIHGDFILGNALFGTLKLVKMQAKINTNIQNMEQGSIITEFFRGLIMAVDLTKMQHI